MLLGKYVANGSHNQQVAYSVKLAQEAQKGLKDKRDHASQQIHTLM